MGDTLDRLDMHADADLMARVRAGDRTAFEVIYRRHEARVFAYLWRLVRDETLAADLRQEVFLASGALAATGGRAAPSPAT